MEKRRASFGFTVRSKGNSAPVSSPTFTPSPPPSKLRRHFNSTQQQLQQQQRNYEFEAPQFYDFTKQSDPEREHWFDCKKKTPSTPDFNFAARSSSSLTATAGKFHSSMKQHHSFMNTPLGHLQAFDGLSSSSVSSSLPRGLKRSASTPNVSLGTRQPLGSDEKKIISCFMNTPVMVIKTPLAKTIHRGSPLPKAQQIQPLKAANPPLPMNLFPSESELPPSYVRETSSLELLLETSAFETTETNDSRTFDEKDHISDAIGTDPAVGQNSIANLDADEDIQVAANGNEANEQEEEASSLNPAAEQDIVQDVQDVQDAAVAEQETLPYSIKPDNHSQKPMDANLSIASKVVTAPAEMKWDDEANHELPSSNIEISVSGDTKTMPVAPKSPELPTVQVPLVSLSLSPFLPPPPSSSTATSSTLQAADAVIRQLALKRAASEQAEYTAFQQSLRAKARAEQERIEALAAANARRLQKLKAGPTVLPAKSTKPLTVPEEFHFEYESRAQLKKMAKSTSNASSENTRPSTLNVVTSRPTFSRFPTIGKNK